MQTMPQLPLCLLLSFSALALAQPSPGDIEKTFCKIARNKFVEGMTTRKVCAQAEKVLNRTMPKCQTHAEQVWDMVAKLCPTEEMELAASADPNGIQDAFCKVASNKFIENTVAGNFCNHYGEKLRQLNVTIMECKTQVEKVWDWAAKMCPKTSEYAIALPELTGPGDIEKIVCKVLPNKVLESMATSKFCAQAEKLLHTTIPECQAHAEQVWETVAKLCPAEEMVLATSAGPDGAAPRLPGPGVVLKMFCKVAMDKSVEDMMTGKVCAQAEKIFPQIPACQAHAEQVWDMAAKLCPQDSDEASVAPAMPGVSAQSNAVYV